MLGFCPPKKEMPKEAPKDGAKEAPKEAPAAAPAAATPPAAAPTTPPAAGWQLLTKGGMEAALRCGFGPLAGNAEALREVICSEVSAMILLAELLLCYYTILFLLLQLYVY